jgi:hypothetical protein
VKGKPEFSVIAISQLVREQERTFCLGIEPSQISLRPTKQSSTKKTKVRKSS